MKSIRKALTRRLTILICLIGVTVLLIADIAVNIWIQDEFNRAMRNKIGLLMTLVSEEPDGLESNIAGEFFPEFESDSEPEYFQLWRDGNVLERSGTLNFYSVRNLPYKTLPQDTIELQDIELPDSRSGRIAYTKFIPQADFHHRDVFSLDKKNETFLHRPIVLAYAASIEKLNYYLWFIDISFALAIIIVLLLIHLTVKNTVSYALSPLETLNKEIKDIRFSSKRDRLALSGSIEELNPIIDSLNHFIKDNYSLYLREKRLTSDIAHELKTPVTELINMAEVAIRFPDEYNLENDFKSEVLKISERMKSIISSLMLMHKYSHQRLDSNEEIDVIPLLRSIIDNKNEGRILFETKMSKLLIRSNTFALESILVNLISNALQHSPKGSKVVVKASLEENDLLKISIINKCTAPLTGKELEDMFEPLWQKDPSRTSAENFGLGLSIVKILTSAIGAEVSTSCMDDILLFEVRLSVR